MSKEEALKRYAILCRTTVQKYIAEGTRFGDKDLEVVSVSTNVAQTKLWGTFELKTQCYEHISPGRSSPVGADVEAYSRDEFYRVQDDILSEYLADHSRFTKLLDALKKGYTAYLHGHKKCFDVAAYEVHYELECSSCGGHGNLRCGGCSGHGEVTCGSCGGGGRTHCSSCGGSGQTVQTEWTTDHDGHSHARTAYHSCSFCCGGQVTCSSCGGGGRETCGRCGGSGEVTCGTCEGSGRRTKTGGVESILEASFKYQVRDGVPDWVKDYLSSRAGHLDLAKLGMVDLTHLVVIKETSVGKAEYMSYVLFAEVVVKLRGVEHTLRLIGLAPTPRICDAGNIFQAMLQPDAEALHEIGGWWWQALDPFYWKRMEPIVATFAQSEVNQKLIDELRYSRSTAKIVKALDNNVSEAYVDTAQTGLITALKRAGAWSSVYRFFWMMVFTWPATLLLLWVREMFTTHRVPQAQEVIVLLRADSFWDFMLMVVAAALLGWGVRRVSDWSSRLWLYRAAGNGDSRLVNLAHCVKAFPLKWTGRLSFVASIALAYGIAVLHPVWEDQYGRVFGVTTVGLPSPRIFLPSLPQVAAVKPKAKKKAAQKRTTTEHQTYADAPS